MITRADYRQPRGAALAETTAAPLTVPGLLERWSHERPDRPALLAPDGDLTWRELSGAVERRARDLIALNVGAGDVVGLQSPNTRHAVVDHLALARCGAVTAMIHRPYPDPEVARLARLVEARFVLRDGQVLGEPPRASGTAAAPPAPDDPLAVFFTSGTEGPTPKACLHSHAGLLGNALAVARDMQLEPTDSLCTASAFTHLFGYLALHLSLVSGAPQVLMERFSPDNLVRVTSRASGPVLFAVPAHLYDLMGAPSALSAMAGRLKEIRSAGAYLPPTLVDRVARRLGAPVVAHWGMSEIGAGLHTRRGDPPEAACETVGRPVGESRVLIVDQGRVIREPGRTGELLFRGPSLFLGYYGDPDATDAAYADVDGLPWLRTGDLAAWSPEGLVRFRGRVKDIVNRGGMKVSAQEVEAAVATLPVVRHAALLAVPDPRLGERGLLVVSLRAGGALTLDEVRRHLDQQGIAKFKWPEALEVLPELPLTATGKVAKGRLRTAMALMGSDQRRTCAVD